MFQKKNWVAHFLHYKITVTFIFPHNQPKTSSICKAEIGPHPLLGRPLYERNKVYLDEIQLLKRIILISESYKILLISDNNMLLISGMLIPDTPIQSPELQTIILILNKERSKRIPSLSHTLKRQISQCLQVVTSIVLFSNCFLNPLWIVCIPFDGTVADSHAIHHKKQTY